MVITTRRKVRRYCFHLLLLALFLIVFVDFDVEQNIRQTPDDSGPRQRRIREKWNEKDEAIPTYYERSRAAWSNLYEVPLTIVQRHVPGQGVCHSHATVQRLTEQRFRLDFLR